MRRGLNFVAVGGGCAYNFSMSLMNQLRGFRALQGFSMQQLAKLGAEGEERDAKPGEQLFRENDEAREMIFLLDGKLELRAASGKHLADVPALNLVGEMGLLTNSPRSATALAAGPCSYLALAREDFFRLTDEDPDLGMKFYRNISSILAEQLKRNNLLVEFFQSLG